MQIDINAKTFIKNGGGNSMQRIEALRKRQLRLALQNIQNNGILPCNSGSIILDVHFFLLMQKEKGLNNLVKPFKIWLPDLDSNQGPAD